MICRRSSTNLHLDTGLLDSHDHFGINTKPKSRFRFRRVTECAPLRTENYTYVNTSGPLFSPRNASLDFMYGGAVQQSGFVYNNITYQTLLSSTLLYPEDAHYQLEFVPCQLSYILTNFGSLKLYTPGSPLTTTFIPIPELQVDDALTALIFLSARQTEFLEQVDDDWYSAHQPGPPIDVNEEYVGEIKVYHADLAANVLGCTMRRQICNSLSGKCSPLSYEKKPATIWSTEEQEKTFDFWWTATKSGSLAPLQIPAFLGNSALKARSSFNQGTQGPLPPNQWQQEVLYWETIGLAIMQRTPIEAVAGPSDSSVQQYVQRNATGSGNFCVNQKIRSTAYTCFSVLGIFVTLVLGGLIILVSNIIESVCTCLKKRQNGYAYKRLEWVTNETLQLQRMVHEELGLGTWTGTASSLPVAKKDEKLGVLDISNEEHPIMVRPPSEQDSKKPKSGTEENDDNSRPQMTTDQLSESAGNVNESSSGSETLFQSLNPDGQLVHVTETLASSSSSPPASPDSSPQPTSEELESFDEAPSVDRSTLYEPNRSPPST